MVIFMYSNIFRDSVNLCVLARIADGFVMTDCHTSLHMGLICVNQMIMDEYMADMVSALSLYHLFFSGPTHPPR